MKLFMRVLYLTGGLLIASVLAFATLQPIKVLPRIKLAPAFALRDQTGAALTSEDLRGQLVLYNITYTGCQAPCPQTAATLRAVQQRLGAANTQSIPVKLVTISFDPDHDSQAVLAAYADRERADPAVWRVATGDPAALKVAIGDGFSLYYAPQADGSFSFDPAFFLVDGWGILRAEYRTAEPGIDRIMRDMALIASEVQNSTGAGKVAYEAAHLFLCYAK
ncbi:SCO family protein [Candidatus Amarolinea aalborgensis]|jgi:protein SCO1/2|uniref:SCO family protein n=1 Tax=Candidatus Amarolinea aalborgensis TaxID=2249329 RepID=UPI003BF9F205